MKEIQPLLEKLAAQFGVTVNHLWEVMVAQARVQAGAYIFQVLILLVVTILAVKASKKIYPDGYNRADGFFEEVLIPLGYIFIALIWFAAFAQLPDLIAMLFNPEYWALQQILDALK